MARWEHRIRIKHLLTDKDDRQSLDKSMNAIAALLTLVVKVQKKE